MDPGWLPVGDATELERRMLEAARRDRIPDALSARMGEMFAGVAAVAATAESALGVPLIVKGGMLGVLSLALVAGFAGWHAARPAAPGAQPARAVRPSSHVAAATTPAARPHPPSASTALAPHAHAADDGDGALHAEIALLDRARDALRTRAGASALQLLDEHRERFARARLAPEALALRIEALVQGGARAQAAALSRGFVAAYPHHPLADHVAQLAPP